MKLADTVVSGADILIEQVAAVPAHAPPHPTKVWPVAGLAVKVTRVPFENISSQSEGQAIPAGALVTTPLPLTETASDEVVGGAALALIEPATNATAHATFTVNSMARPSVVVM